MKEAVVFIIMVAAMFAGLLLANDFNTKHVLKSYKEEVELYKRYDDTMELRRIYYQAQNEDGYVWFKDNIDSTYKFIIDNTKAYK